MAQPDDRRMTLPELKEWIKEIEEAGDAICIE